MERLLHAPDLAASLAGPPQRAAALTQQPQPAQRCTPHRGCRTSGAPCPRLACPEWLQLLTADSCADARRPLCVRTHAATAPPQVSTCRLVICADLPTEVGLASNGLQALGICTVQEQAREAAANGVAPADQHQVFQLFRMPGMPEATEAALLQRVSHWGSSCAALTQIGWHTCQAVPSTSRSLLHLRALHTTCQPPTPEYCAGSEGGA